MTDPNPVAADPTPTPTPAPPRLPLAVLYPACFDWEHPRPLKRGIHRDMWAAGLQDAGVTWADLKRTLRRYCLRPRYWKTVRAGALRIDLAGQPAGTVTDEEALAAQAARAAWNARQAGVCSTRAAVSSPAARRPNTPPLPQASLVPGRLELTVRFSEWPQPVPVQGGVKLGIQTAEGLVTAIIPATVWRRLEQAVKDAPHGMAALSGSLARVAEGEMVLQHPTVQVFDKKGRPETPGAGRAAEPTAPTPEATASMPTAPMPNAPTPKGAEPKGPEAKVSPTPAPPYPTLSLKGRGAAKTG